MSRLDCMISRLESVLGAGAVQVSGGTGAVQVSGGTGAVQVSGGTAAGREPEVWANPADEGQVQELLAWATREKVAVYPRGGGTRWRAAFRPFRAGVGLETSRLDALEELDAENLTVVAGAGMRHAALQRLLGIHGLFFPPEVAWPEASTLGGEVATDSSGPRRFAYGSVRAYLLGCRVFFPGGAGGLFGGKQVKNASGYDVARFLCGSWGSLGVITQVILKVRPRPERTDVQVFTGPAERLLAAAEEIRQELYGVAAIEVLLGEASSWWWDEVASQGRPTAGGGAGLLLVGTEGTSETVEWQVAWLEGLAGRHGVILQRDLFRDEERDAGGDTVSGAGEAAWRARGRLFDRAASAGASVWNLAVLPGDLVTVVQSVLRAEGKGDLPAGTWGVAAHAGDGHAHLFCTGQVAAGDGSPARALEVASGAVRAAGGYLLADDAALGGTAHEVVPGMGALATVWRRLKEELDPAGILSPAGRVGGGGV